MARILLGVTGGIAAYKALELTRLATKAGHSVRVIQTEASKRFVGTASFAAITGAPVLVTEWDPDPMRGAFPGDPAPAHDPLSHLELVANADVYVIAPASANTIAKLAGGQADNLLTAAALASRGPLLVAPAMNDAMYEHPATQDNIARLRARGVTVLDPGVGALGSPGEWGIGRLPEPAELLAAIDARLSSPLAASSERAVQSTVPFLRPGQRRPETGVTGGDLDGLSVLVTAGGTREPIDAVRYVGNRSSGRMGFALADEAARRGARVTVIAANVGLDRNPAVTYVDVETAEQLQAAAQGLFPTTDVLLMAAAVADYRPAAPADGKLKKDATGDTLRIDLERTDDILNALAEVRRAGQTLVGFAAEHGPQAVEYGRGKLERKNLDAVVVNDIAVEGIGFDAADNEVTILTRDREQVVDRRSKPEVAGAILDTVLILRSSSAMRVD